MIITENNFDHDLEKFCGGKATNLFILRKNNIMVPPLFVIGIQEYENHINSIQNFDELLKAKIEIENAIGKFIYNRGEIVAKNAKERNANTIYFVLYGEKAELLSMKFDMQNMDVSTGSACSSGIIKENRVLLSKGLS